MTLNQELILTRCHEIEESLVRLEKIAEKEKSNFLEDRDAQDIACYRLLVAIEAALGLCYHVSAKKLTKVPGEYAECFVILADAGIIPMELSDGLQRIARFRNLLVHMYWKVDYGFVYEIINNNLNDLRLFSKVISALL